MAVAKINHHFYIKEQIPAAKVSKLTAGIYYYTFYYLLK